jgi:hypothetical protein
MSPNFANRSHFADEFVPLLTWVGSPEMLDLSNNEIPAAIMSIPLPMPSKLHVLQSELQRRLKDHQQLVKCWMCDVDWLWDQTQNRHTKFTHPWFDCMADLREQHHENALNSIDNAMELLGFYDDPPDEVEGVRNEAQQLTDDKDDEEHVEGE